MSAVTATEPTSQAAPVQTPDAAPDDAAASGQTFTPPKVETAEYLQMLRRMIRAAGRRVGDADEIELGMLIDITTAACRDAVQEAVDMQRARGVSWKRIGESIGITPQTAQQRWGGTRKADADGR